MSEHGSYDFSGSSHRVQTTNVSLNSENKIHDNTVAQRYGFTGGLVPGTMVYAHLTYPLVERFGEPWLARSRTELRLLKPAYDREWLTVLEEPPEEEHATAAEIVNEQGETLATVKSELCETLPPLHALAPHEPAPPGGERPPVAWDLLQVQVPFRALPWTPTPEQNAQWCDNASEPLQIYRGGPGAPVHPGLVLQAANNVFTHNFHLEPWIHVSSDIVHRAPLQVGEPVEVRAVPTEKWEHKGHQFVTLYVVMWSQGQPAVEVLHTAIFRVRPKA